MTLNKAIFVTEIVLGFHFLGLILNLYEIVQWYDIPMHFGGGLAMGALGLAIWSEGIEEVKFKGWFQKHLKWWLVPIIVIGFVSLIGILWELHEYVLDQLLPARDIYFSRQPGIADTMMDFVMDLLGGIVALAMFWKR